MTQPPTKRWPLLMHDQARLDAARGDVATGDIILTSMIFLEDQIRAIKPALDIACDAIECWVKDGIAKAMSRYNAEE